MERLTITHQGAGRYARPLLLLVFVVWSAACGSGDGSGPRLLDGSRAPPVPDALRSLRDAVATKVHVLPARAAGVRSRACVRRFSPVRPPPETVLVERTGLVSRSATFRVGNRVYGCDATAGPKEVPGPWCGGSVGRTDLPTFDPRLDILCRDPGGGAVGLAWIDPLDRARYVVVRDRTRAEVYPVAAGMPVRVETHDVDISKSGAKFRVEQYDAHGRRLARQTLSAFVAG